MGEIAKTVRVPLDINFSIGSSIADGTLSEVYGITNGIVDINSGGSENARFVTQRPGFGKEIDNTTADVAGRGIYHWGRNSAYYIVNDDAIYKNTYATTVGAITSGYRRCTIRELGTQLLVIDSQNNQGWTITTADVLAQITDTDFPTDLVAGCAILNGRAYVADSTGVIYNSALDDATSWNALEFTEAEREPDGAHYIGKHHDHVVVFGSSTIEFFFDNSENQPSGSTLRRRDDVVYTTGALLEDAVWEYGDITFFLGTTRRGDCALYKLDNFQISLISLPDLSAYLNDRIFRDDDGLLLTGIVAKGRPFLLVHQTSNKTSYNITRTYVFDVAYNYWYLWNYGGTPISDFTLGGGGWLNIIDWAYSSESAVVNAYGIIKSGDLISVINQRGGTVGGQDVDYAATPDVSKTTQLIIETPPLDGGTLKYKYCRRLFPVVHQTTGGAASLSVDWANEETNGVTGSPRTINLADDYRGKLTRLGRFRRRRWYVAVTSTSSVRLEALELEVAIGDV